jgi:hypothetical protein
VGFGVGLPGFFHFRLFLGIGLWVGFGVTLASLAIGLTDFVDLVCTTVFIAFVPVEAIAVPVKRKAAAVIDASSFINWFTSFQGDYVSLTRKVPLVKET